MSSELAKSIAVLPFVNISSNQEAEYFSDGMTEEIIHSLSKIQELNVTARTSSFAFRNSKTTISEIGEQLNVSILLQGSVRLAGDSVRISVQLIEATSDFQFWSETFDRNINKIFVVQDEISLLIADRLREHLGHFDVKEQLVDNYNVSLSTYKKYLKGRFYLMKLDYPNSIKAIGIFEEVIEEASDFPMPYLDINQAYIFMGTMGLISSMEAFTKAQPFLEKAIELKPDLPQTQLNLAWISCWQKWDLKSAYTHLNNALSIRASDEMYITMANLLTVEGKLDVAMKYTDKALEIAPFSSVNLNYKGFLFYMQENYDQALPYFKRSLELQAELPFPVVYIGSCYLLSGEFKKGLTYFENLPEDTTGYLAKLGGTSLAHAMMGNIKEAEVGIAQLEEYLESPSAGNALNFLILCHTQLQQIDRAIQYIQQGKENHFPLILLLPTEPIAKALHAHPEFIDLINNLIAIPEKVKPQRKYKKPLFTDHDLKNYKKRLETLMKEDKLFLNPELTLRILAEFMNLPTNHISQLLNEGFEQNFAEYVNNYRLEYFKKQLMSQEAHQLTLLALAYDSGFNSKTVFNTFFKKKMGVTPKMYWNQQRK